jgi:hypothetical protein
MVSDNPEMQKSRQNADFFFAVRKAVNEGVAYFQYPETPTGEFYSTLKNIEDYALLPFDKYMAKNGRVGADRWAQINGNHRFFLPEPTVPPEYRVNHLP